MPQAVVSTEERAHAPAGPKAAAAKRLAVFLLHGYYPDDPRVRRQAEALARSGWRVRVYCTPADEPGARFDCEGVEVVTSMRPKRRGGLLQYGLEYLRTTAFCMQELEKLCRNSRPDLITIATLPDFLIWASVPAKIRGVPVLLDLHESMPDFFATRYKGIPGRVVRMALDLLEKQCASLATGLMTVNDEMADTFENRLGRRPDVIANTADENHFTWSRQKVLWPKGPRTLSYHGTITDIYGLDLLLDAMPRVLEAHPNTRLEIFGDGPARPALEAQSEKLGLTHAVSFRGRVPFTDMSEHLRNVHVGVVPTRKDDFLNMTISTKLLEYVYLGMPVVSSDLAAIQRSFAKCDSLFFFEGNSTRSLADTIIEVLGSPKKTIQEHVNNATRDYQAIAWPIMERRFTDVMTRLAKKT